jgi:hypothetical protein
MTDKPVYPCGGPSDRGAGGCGATLTREEAERGSGFCPKCRTEKESK